MVKKQTKTSNKKSEGLHLTVSKRKILGKKVRQLRRDGVLPANIYGSDFISQAISIAELDFKHIHKKSGETSVIHLAIDGESSEIPVLIHGVQTHPVNDRILHVDFRKVDLKKKIQTLVPVKLTGESDAVLQKKGVLQTIVDTLAIEAFPDKIPSEIEIDISVLKEVGDEVKVANLKATGEYIFVDEPSRSVVRIIEHKEEEIAPQIEPETPEEDKETETPTEEKPAEGAQTTAKTESEPKKEE